MTYRLREMPFAELRSRHRQVIEGLTDLAVDAQIHDSDTFDRLQDREAEYRAERVRRAYERSGPA